MKALDHSQMEGLKDRRSDLAPKRIRARTSRTAEWTCMSRAVSSFEIDPHYRSDDFIAPRLVPAGILPLMRTRIGRTVFRHCLSARGMYEYVIARTKYIDSVFKDALDDRLEQIVLLGAGFDARAIRFLPHL